MSKSVPKTSPFKKQQKPSETSESIQSQIEAFLKSGGEIDVIDSGVSGRESMRGPKHITISSKEKG